MTDSSQSKATKKTGKKNEKKHFVAGCLVGTYIMEPIQFSPLGISHRQAFKIHIIAFFDVVR